MKKPKQPVAIINGQVVPGSFYGKLCKRFGKHLARRILYRAKDAKNIIKWISKGITKKGEYYALSACSDEFDNKPAVEVWIEKNINRRKPEPKRKPVTDRKKEPDKLSNILESII